MAGRVLNNVTTADAYTAANTVEEPRGIEKLNLIVANAAIYLQLAVPQSAGRSVEWDSLEEFMVPGFYNKAIDCRGFRIRSAVAGVPARVTVRGS